MRRKFGNRRAGGGKKQQQGPREKRSGSKTTQTQKKLGSTALVIMQYVVDFFQLLRFPLLEKKYHHMGLKAYYQLITSSRQSNSRENNHSGISLCQNFLLPNSSHLLAGPRA